MNQEMFSLFWYWINERHSIYLARQAGLPKPWSRDSIFRKHFFCNVFRELDPGTIWLRENWTDQHPNEGALLVFNCLLYRLFNLESTAKALGFQTKWDEEEAIKRLTMVKESQNLYSSAYMIRGKEGEPKYITQCRLFTQVWVEKEELYEEIFFANSLEYTTNLLCKYDLIGLFTAYEIATDLRHTPVLENAEDIMTWANAGPGAWRGIQHIWPEAKVKEAVACMRELLDAGFQGSHVPPLEMRDIEHSLCEYDKYVRASRGAKMKRRYEGAV